MANQKFHISTIFKAIDKFSGPVSRMSTRFGQFSRKMKKGMMGIRKMTSRVARGIKGIGISFATAALVGGYALKALFGPAARFEHAMAGVNAVTLGTIENMEELKDLAKFLGRTTIFKATDVGGAMEILARAGLSGKEIKDSIDPVLRAASAGGASIGETAKVVISTIKGFGPLLEFKDAKRVSDTFALIAASAKTTIVELGEGLSKVAPVAQQFGLKFEDVAAAVATLQDAGVEASMSGTQLKTMLTKLAMLTAPAAARFRRLGIDIESTKGNMKTMPNLIGAISEGLDKAGGNMDKVKAIATAVGLRGSTAANLLASAWKSGKLPDLLEKISNKALDAAGDMDRLRQASLMGDLTKLKSAWEGFRIDIATGSLPELRDLTQNLTEWFSDPANIIEAADALNGAVDGLKDFWTNNRNEMVATAEGLWKVVAGMWAMLKLFGRFMGFMGGMSETWYDFVTSFGPTKWVETKLAGAYGFDDPNAVESRNTFRVSGLTPGYSQEPKPYLKGEIVIRDDQNRVAGVSSSSGQVSLQIERNGGLEEANESAPGGASYPGGDY